MELISYYKINSANVAVDGNCGSSPRSVLRRAEELVRSEEKKGDGFDRVYCVFDKDEHESFDEVIEIIKAKKGKCLFFATTSIPCFEYWLLLHFQYTTKPFHRAGKSSIANEVLKELKGYMPNYSKGDKDVFSHLFGQTDFAKANAARSLSAAENNHTSNPTTKVHELIDYLENLKT